MHIKKVFLLLCLSFVFASISAQKSPVHVLITAGQSNTDGRVNNKLLPDYIKTLATDTVNYAKGQYKFGKIAINRNDGLFEPYWPKGRITSGLWTYDAVTYYLLGQALQEDFYVIKYAVGGTSIQFPNDSAKGRYWSADPDWLAKTVSVEKGGKSLLLSFTDGIDAAIDQNLSKLTNGYQIDAFLWHQGESDDRYAGKYYGNLKAVITYVRKHLTEKTGKDYSKLPFIFGSIPQSNRHYKPEIDAAMQRIADEDQNVYLIDMSEGELQRDRTHFNEKSAEYLGIEMYRKLEKILQLNKFGFRVAKYKGDKTCAISYTFDDALQEHFTLVAPALEKLGFRGTFWINGNTVENTPASSDKPRMTWEELKKMAKNGHEISNHGWSHKSLTRLQGEALRTEIQRNDTAIFLHTNIFPRTYCYAGNAKNDTAIMAASANRVATRLVQFSVGGKSTPENLDSRIAGLLENGDWGVTMTHGINYGYDHFRNAEIFWEHLRKVKVQEDRIWVGTFCEVAAYTKEQKDITCTITQTDKGFSVIPKLSLDKNLFTEMLTAVIEQENIQKIVVRQGKKELKTQIYPHKLLFDFDPWGGAIDITIQKRN